MALYGTSDRTCPCYPVKRVPSRSRQGPFAPGPRGVAAVAFTREFSFRSITLAILGFVFLYVFTLRGGEILVRHRVGTLVTRAVMTQSEELLSGRIGYDEFVTRKVEEVRALPWLRTLVRLGLDLSLRVKTQRGEILYPRVREWFPTETTTGPGPEVSGAEAQAPTPVAPAVLARENYRLLREGIVIDVDPSIGNNTWLANGILVFYLFALLQVLWVLARGLVRRTEEEKLELAERLEREQRERVSQIEGELSAVRARLADVVRDEGEQATRIRDLEQEKRKLEERLGGWSWEDASELEKELERLEVQLRGAQAERERQERAIRELNESIRAREAKPVPRARAREADLLDRRLRTLYKNLDFENRVIADLINLGDDEALLRAEEVIKRLNDRDENLSIRRKVGGLERATVFELGFGAKGRIYYTHAEGGRPRIILVGAKNTQDKDLTYLRRYRESPSRPAAS